jgi:hypothetical protein
MVTRSEEVKKTTDKREELCFKPSGFNNQMLGCAASPLI